MINLRSSGSPANENETVIKKNDMIYVFKTSVNCNEDIQRIKSQLETMQWITKWNFDLEDCDRIFRVETSLNDPGRIIEILQENGYECEELPF